MSQVFFNEIPTKNQVEVIEQKYNDEVIKKSAGIIHELYGHYEL